MSSSISFAGLVTNLPTDQLIAAIINQESQPMVRMQTQQTTNNTKSAALQTLSLDLTGLSTAMDSLTLSGFNGNTVTSSDSTGTNVSATSSGAASGVYSVAVKALATTARIVVPTPLASNAAIGQGNYVITDMSGNQATVTIDGSNNSLAGFAAAVNNAKDASGNALNVNATVIQTGATGTSQLVMSANTTGTGASGASTFSIAMAAGSALDPTSQGTFTSSAATNSDFFINGVELQRNSNTVSDAVQGVTFNLNQAQADLTKTTTLTVGVDAAGASKAMQAVVTAYNQFYKDYTSNAKFTRNTDGSYTAGVFNMDMTVQNIVNQVSDTLMNPAPGMSSSALYTTPAAVGLKTNQDGTLSFDSGAFQTAYTANPKAVANLFTPSGTSTSALMTFVGATNKTTTSPINFSIVADTNGDGGLTGTFNTTDSNGQPQAYTLSSSDGYFTGVAGTALEGLSVQAQVGATGSLNVSAGIGAYLDARTHTLTDLNPGDLGGLISDLGTQNSQLNVQIAQQQNYLTNSKAALEKTYSNLETSVSSLTSASQSLSTLA